MTVIPALRAAGVECFTRAEWGSPRERDGSYARRRTTHPMPAGPARYHFLHITVTADTDTVAEGAAGALQIEGYGYSTPPMVSYQDLVTNEGRYYEGQSYGVKGTHTINDKNVADYPTDLNYYGYATALMQNVGDEVTDAQVQVVAMIFAARELAGLVVRHAPILPHRTFAWKSCPGDKAVARLDEITRLRDRYVRDGLPGGDDMAEYGERILTAIERLDEREKARDAAGRERDKKRHQAVLALLDKAIDDIDHTASKAQVKRLRDAVDALAAPAPDPEPEV